MPNSIFKILEKLNLTSTKTRKLFNNKTRDIEDLEVWKDEASGVIYIDNFYTGNQTYIDGKYRNNTSLNLQSKPEFEHSADAERRFKANLKFVTGKRIADFGCGNGKFLQLVNQYCSSVIGIELQEDYVKSLNSLGISCINNLSKLEKNSIDTVVSFHVIEHLLDPVSTLSEIREKIVSGGTILIEVPHANDFLLSVVSNEKFKQFTLWSQHLILHTRESLRCILEASGFKDIEINGVQRYPLSNHLNWLTNGKAAGRKSNLSIIDTPTLNAAYENSLAHIDATDTLVAIAKVS